MTYQAVFERAPDGSVWGYVPELPGATGSGNTLAEAKASLEAGARIWIEDALADGEALPQPSTLSAEPIDVVLA